MGRARRNEKKVEIHETLIIRTASGSLPGMCEERSESELRVEPRMVHDSVSRLRYSTQPEVFTALGNILRGESWDPGRLSQGQ